MPDLIVASYNIHKGIGIDRRRDLGRIAHVIEELDADVVALQEADARFGARQGLLDLDRLAAMGLKRVEVRGLRERSHGWHGNVMLVRRDTEVEGVERLALPGLEPRGAIVADLVVKSAPVRVIGTHLALLGQSRIKQVAMVLDRLAALSDRPTVLMGDTNEWRRGEATLKGFLPHFPHGARAPSFPAPFPILPLDRVMLSHGRIEEFTVHVSALSRRASDHLPVRARLVLPE
ncbi:endonuclease/exonuclease/phosphatase family protein [Falsirhodobacter sp. 20TX0035]|uniref:endonuclease/exonuclease/phosphatase family protein n=1 Tax=Falsirhodobacter sp. 20TX0035 TaxID=3022019 RepID=UPI0023311517|nr:endonuclease/exonuclease/phosphatase family protein [Falsirhodobacter sp. 20TX0035]MDB6453928.1 endonuclease/exonuclease/phosphatase family protein [Falsirhodobacter sp. 20TX0035]